MGGLAKTKAGKQSSATKSLTLAVTPSIKLRENQAKLYEFILNKYETGGTITLNEVVEQYSQYGNRNIRNGVPYAYGFNWDSPDRRYELVPLKGDELRSWSVQWFIRNLGIFVVKGLLTAIPTMRLADLQIEADTQFTGLPDNSHDTTTGHVKCEGRQHDPH